MRNRWIGSRLIALTIMAGSICASSRLHADEAANSTPPLLRGSKLSFDNQVTAISFDRSYDNSYNPVYVMSGTALGVWNVGPKLSLSSNLGFDLELTDSDASTKRNQAYLRDLPVNASWRTVDATLGEFARATLGLSASATLPISEFSRYTTLHTALGLGATIGLAFDRVFGGLRLAWSPRITRFIHASQTPVKRSHPLSDNLSVVESRTSTQYQALRFGGGTNPSWSLANTVGIDLSFTKQLSLSVAYTHTYVRKYAPQTADEGTGVLGLYMNGFVYELAYQLPEKAAPLTIRLGAMTFANQLRADGSYERPFFNRETVVSFGLDLDLHRLAERLQEPAKKKR